MVLLLPSKAGTKQTRRVVNTSSLEQHQSPWVKADHCICDCNMSSPHHHSRVAGIIGGGRPSGCVCIDDHDHAGNIAGARDYVLAQVKVLLFHKMSKIMECKRQESNKESAGFQELYEQSNECSDSGEHNLLLGLNHANCNHFYTVDPLDLVAPNQGFPFRILSEARIWCSNLHTSWLP